jgi:hypothetical protein
MRLNGFPIIRVYLGVFGPVGPVSENPELLVIPGFRDGTLGLWTTRTALSIHVCRGKYNSLVLGGRDGLPLDPSGLLPSPLVFDERLVADPAVVGASRRQNPTSRFALLALDDQVFPRMRVWQANGSSQTAADLGCSTPLGEGKADLKQSR